APPDERGGNRHGRPNTTAPHLDSTISIDLGAVDGGPEWGTKSGSRRERRVPAVGSERRRSPERRNRGAGTIPAGARQAANLSGDEPTFRWRDLPPADADRLLKWVKIFKLVRSSSHISV